MNHFDFSKMKLKQYHMIRVIGSGSFAQVWEAFDSVNNITVAVKAIPEARLKDKKIKQLVQSQVYIMKSIKNNPNVVRLIDNFKCCNSILIVMQYCNDGNLQEMLTKQYRFPEDKAVYYLKQIINGFKGLHEVNVIHRDFKAENILLSKGVPKIADLGFAKMLSSPGGLAQTILGTSLTMAPQVHKGEPYGMKADIWSLGIVFYQLLYGNYPYNGKDDNQLQKAIKSRPRFDGLHISANAKDFIDKCLTYEAKNRISWAQLYRHPLITELGRTVFNVGARNKLQKNVQFYDKNSKLKEINYFEYGLSNISEVQAQVQMMKEFESLQQNHELMKHIEEMIQVYKDQYLGKYNSILFMFKHICPYIPSIVKMPLNHANYLFVLAKKTYLDFLEMASNIKNNKNFLGIDSYFQQFTKSDDYRAIHDMVQDEIAILEIQIEDYKDALKGASPEVMAEQNFKVIKNKNWPLFVRGLLEEYEYMLMDGLDLFKGESKTNLILVIEAVIYLQGVKKDNEVARFERHLKKLDWAAAEKKIRGKLEERLKSFID